jgi:hypothetical protein
MAIPFAATATASQDSTGQIVTLTDTSPYGAASNESWQPANFSSRVFVLTDAYGNQLAVVPLIGTNLTAQYALTADQWVNMQLQLTGINPTPNYNSVIYGLPFDRITKNLYRALLKSGCCQGKFEENQLYNADNYFLGASIEALSGNGAGFNVDIQAANAYLSPNP